MFRYPLGDRSITLDAARLRVLLSELGLPPNAVAYWINKIILVPSGTGDPTIYPKTATGLANAITASASADKIIVPNGTITGNHTNKAGVEIIGWGQNTILSGTITNNGILTNLQLTGTYTNNGYFNHATIPTGATVLGGIYNVIKTNDYSAIVTGYNNSIDGSAGGTTNKNFIGGGQNNAINTIVTVATTILNFIGGGLSNLIQNASHAAIGGGQLNQILAGWGAINGGEDNGIYVKGIHGFIGGGYDNAIGRSSTLNTRWGVIAGGYFNEIDDADYGAILGGRNGALDTSPYSVVGGGFGSMITGATAAGIFSGNENAITGNYASILGGNQAVANKYGQVAHSAGRFAANGDAQRSHFVVRRSVTHSDASWYELFLDGSAARMTIAADTVWTFKILLVGTSQGCAKSFGFEINGVIENDGGTTSLLASNVTTLYDTDDVSFDARVSADDTNDALLVEVTDADGASDVVRWVANVETAEVTFPA